MLSHEQPLPRFTFGQVLRTERKKQSKTIQEIAATLGLIHAHISKIENGKANATLNVVEKYANALGLDLVDLFFRAKLSQVPSRASQQKLAKKIDEALTEIDKLIELEE